MLLVFKSNFIRNVVYTHTRCYFVVLQTMLQLKNIQTLKTLQTLKSYSILLSQEAAGPVLCEGARTSEHPGKLMN